MDFALRLLAALTLGAFLLIVNIWFVRSVRQTFFANDFVIAPFQIIQEADAGPHDGEALARMLNARLGDLQRKVQIAQQRPDGWPAREQSGEPPPTVATLFVPRQVDIPTDLLQPVNVNVSVGGVEVGGLFSWLQRSLRSRRTLTFTVLYRGDMAIVSADVSGFVRSGNPYLWFESRPGGDDVTTNLAYALIQRKLAEDAGGEMAGLEVRDFRALLDTVLEVEELNRKVRRRQVVDREFTALLPTIEALIEKVPEWYELVYLAASIAEGAGNQQRARDYYRRLDRAAEDASTPPNSSIAALVRDKLTQLGVPLAGRGDDEAQKRFVRAAHDFGKLMGLPPPDPEIAFVEPEQPVVQALWNGKKRRYEVNPRFQDTEGLPQYIALSGRFMQRNFERCFGDGTAAATDASFWNDFRYSVIDYLIQTVPEFSDVQLMGPRFTLYQVLKRMEGAAGTEAVQRLALELLERYECDWAFESVEETVVAIGNQRGLVSEQIVRRAFHPDEETAA